MLYKEEKLLAYLNWAQQKNQESLQKVLHKALSNFTSSPQGQVAVFPPSPGAQGIDDLNDTVLGYEVIAEPFPKERFPGWRLSGKAGG